MADELIRFIRTHGVDALENKFAIKSKRHCEYNNLVLFKYNQIESPMDSIIVQQARGIILDEDDDWKVISYPYNKFFNIEESHVAEIDWTTARVYEKLDGSLMTLYYYDNKWHVSSSGMPDAAGPVSQAQITFKELFWKIWDNMGYKLPNNTEMCYMFEMMVIPTIHKIVIRHSENKIVLHGARRLTDYKEVNPIVVAHENGWEVAKIHPFSTLEEAVAVAKALPGLESEGYVIADANYNRVKVKSLDYVNRAYFEQGLTTRKIIEAVCLQNEHSEVSCYLEEDINYYKFYMNVMLKFEKLVSEIEGYYDAVKDIEHQKDFAAKVKHKKYAGALFDMRNKGHTAREFLSNMNIKNLEDWLEINFVEL